MIWLQSVVSAPKRSTAESLLAAAFFATQVAVATLLITAAYAVGGRLFPASRGAGLTWAVVSAILVLYPGITQSLAAALLRIAANVLGSVIGFLVGYFVGTGIGHVVLALTGTIVAGELLRMDLALRTACVATVIVMSANDHQVSASVVERLTAVAVGCGAALAVQLAGRPVRRFLPFVPRQEVRDAPRKEAENAAE